MKAYTVEISEEVEASIQYIIDTNLQSAWWPPSSNVSLGPNPTISIVLQKLLDARLLLLTQNVSLLKDAELLKTLKENSALVQQVETIITDNRIQAAIDAKPVEVLPETPTVVDPVIEETGTVGELPANV